MGTAVRLWASCQECPLWRVRLCVHVKLVQPLVPEHGQVDNERIWFFAGQEAPVPRQRHDCVDHVLEGADPAAAATAWMKAVCTPLRLLLKLYSIVLSVTTAVICFLNAQLYPSTNSHWRSKWLPLAENV